MDCSFDRRQAEIPHLVKSRIQVSSMSKFCGHPWASIYLKSLLSTQLKVDSRQRLFILIKEERKWKWEVVRRIDLKENPQSAQCEMIKCLNIKQWGGGGMLLFLQIQVFLFRLNPSLYLGTGKRNAQLAFCSIFRKQQNLTFLFSPPTPPSSQSPRAMPITSSGLSQLSMELFFLCWPVRSYHALTLHPKGHCPL